MKRLLILSILLAGVFAASAADTAKVPPLKVYLAQKLSDSVTAGNMTDPAIWKKVMQSGNFGLFTFGSKGQPKNRTFFQAGYNVHGLFTVVTAYEPALDKLDFSRQAHADASDGNVFSKPVIELFLDPPFSRKVGIHVVSNINTETYSRMHNNAVFDHPYQVDVKAFPEEGCYRTWFFIPWKETSHVNPEVYIFSMTPQANPVIGFDVGREQLIGDGELSQWNPTTITFLQPGQFGALVLSEEENIQEKMLTLFTDIVISGGLEIQGPAEKTAPLLTAILNSKMQKMEHALQDMKPETAKKYQADFEALKQQSGKDLSADQRQNLLNQVLLLNRKIDLEVFDSLKNEIFDEI